MSAPDVTSALVSSDEFQVFEEIMQGYVDNAQDIIEGAEKWAIGTVEGVPLPPTSDLTKPGSNNNSKYYSDAVKNLGVSAEQLTEGSQPRVEKTYIDDSAHFTFYIPKGDTGNGISSITKTGTSGNIDTYTITFTDNTTTTFSITNGDLQQNVAISTTSPQNGEILWVNPDEEVSDLGYVRAVNGILPAANGNVSLPNFVKNAIGTSALSNVDNITENGIYQYGLSSTGAPTAAGGFVLHIQNSAGSWKYQLFFVFSNGVIPVIYSRSYNNASGSLAWNTAKQISMVGVTYN